MSGESQAVVRDRVDIFIEKTSFSSKVDWSDMSSVLDLIPDISDYMEIAVEDAITYLIG